jgi:hypothetical protein
MLGVYTNHGLFIPWFPGSVKAQPPNTTRDEIDLHVGTERQDA